VLLLPRDVVTAPAPERSSPTANLGRFPLDRTAPDPAAVARAADLVAGARDPVVVAGGGVDLSGASTAVAALQERASLPIGTTTMGKGAVDELHPLSLGVVSNYMGRTSTGHHLRELVQDADVVVFVGSRTNENGTDAWRAFPRDAAFVQVDVDSTEIGRNYEPTVRLLGDATLTLRCPPQCAGGPRPGPAARCASRTRGAHRDRPPTPPGGGPRTGDGRHPTDPARAGRGRTRHCPRRPSRGGGGRRQLFHDLDGQLLAVTASRPAFRVIRLI
jgi:acetolactate synthase-1/2/3 large subunit